MRAAPVLLAALVLFIPASAAGQAGATWYEKAGYRFAIAHMGMENDNAAAWLCGGTYRLQQIYTVRFRSSAPGICGSPPHALTWSAGQEMAANLPCEGAEAVWKQFRGAKGETPAEFLYSSDGRPTGAEVAAYFDATCRGKRIETKKSAP